MAKIKYEDWAPKGDTLVVIDQAETIARDYRNQGYDLTLRQLYYQFVARGLIANHDREYKRLGSIINNARMAGLFDWNFIVDRTRNIRGIFSYPTAEERIASLADGYFEDHWVDQDFYIEVWVEKEALAGVVQRAASQYDVPYFSCRGYVSQSELWGAGQRLLRKIIEGKTVVILHLGDHDPSGIDMTRDITERLSTFTTQDFLDRNVHSFEEDDEGIVRVGTAELKRQMAALTAHPELPPIEVRRIALNMDQVEEYTPPPNPAKLTDSRAGGYVEAFGDESWELDALDPATLNDLISSHIDELIDQDAWDVHDETQETERARLRLVADRYREVADEVGGEGL